MYILRLEVKQHVSALYGHYHVFLFPLRFRCINCDVEISHSIIILVCLCIGGYYITLIYIYIFSLSFGRGEGFYPGVISWMSTSSSSGGCCHEAVNGWPSGNGLTCGGTLSVSNPYWELGAMCVRGGYMKMVLTCVEASLCVSICCGPDCSPILAME